ncbi:unnamed protein product [Effrenium voratum]|nr:unnamed protein product [Effrenium voratum]
MNGASVYNSSVAAQIKGQPLDAIAAVQLSKDGEVARLSYAELMAWANDIASKIAETGVQRAAFRDYLLVALLADRSLLAVAAIFGIWQAGGAYAPVPKDAPTARQKVLCFEADLVVTDSVEKCNEFQCALLIGSSLMDTPKDWRIPNPEQTCMVIYTSGSTGRPKGVLCSHKCLWHSVHCFIEDIDANANSRLLWKTPYQWRTAEYEIFSPLCVGGTLYISPEGSQRQLRNLAHLLHFHSITAFTAVPSVLSSFVNYLGQHSLSHVAAVGEPLPSTLCKPCLDNGIILRNYYGLTETAMTTWVCTRVPSSSVAPAGRPQPEAQVMLLSHPEGDPQQEGEIFFSGIMSQGYLNMPELTAQLFHEVDAGTRFQTGDFGAWNAEGELEVWGRKDAQVKLNGVRIELGEIEAILASFCKETAVVQAADHTLVGFVTRATMDEGDLKEKLARQLPGYMVPARLIQVWNLPRLSSEKVDRKTLREWTVGLTPRADIEARVAAGEVGEEVIRQLDSLGFERALSKQQMELKVICDNLCVLGMLDVILFHWFWCVLIEPRTYQIPASGLVQPNSVTMQSTPVASWVLQSYRVATQDWAYGVFALAAAQTSERWFTRRDSAMLGLYFYTGAFPMLLSCCFSPPLDSIVYHAETVQRWFLLSLLLGKATLVAGHWSGGVGLAQLCMLCILVFMPPCFVDFGASGRYLLPTEWWPTSQSCLLTPKVVMSALLYVGFSHFERSSAQLVLRSPPLKAAFVFFAACALSDFIPVEEAIEGYPFKSFCSQALARFLGLVIVPIQTLSLASAMRPVAMLWHWRWPAKFLLGSYLLNLNFLDVVGLSPDSRRHLLERLQSSAGPLESGIYVWTAMLVPAVLFMTCAAPMLQTLFITWPWRLASAALQVAQFCFLWASRLPERQSSGMQQKLLEDP